MEESDQFYNRVVNCFQHFPARMAENFSYRVKNLAPLQKQHLYYHFVKIRQNYEAILVQKSVKIPGFQYFHMEKIKEKTKHSYEFSPFLALSGKIQPKFGHRFVLPLLIFAAKESASWEHCFTTRKNLHNKYPYTAVQQPLCPLHRAKIMHIRVQQSRLFLTKLSLPSHSWLPN
jgi:hypothetical protein